MIEPELDVDPYIEQIASAARRPVSLDAGARGRLLAAIRAEPRPRRERGVMGWAVDRRFAISPMASLAAAAGLVGIGVGLGALSHVGRDGHATGQPQAVAVSPGRLPASDTVVRFVYLAPKAAHVSVVGDFNQWNRTATPMVRSNGSGLWTVSVPLDAGRHAYALIVDGEWQSDPSAPLAPDDGFGHANSVVVVSKGSTL